MVGQLEVPHRALEHYHVVEATGCATILTDGREKIIGTTNDKKPNEPVLELYGWAPCVPKHIDDFGYIYLCPLKVCLSRLSAAQGLQGVDLFLRCGGVYRLDDRATHWTRDAGPAVALYTGYFTQPADDLVMEMFKRGLALLARGSRAAPRVKMGFRCPAPWECWVDIPKVGRDLVPLTEAKRHRSWFIATCAMCEKPAYSIDRHHPYHQEHNRCRDHFKEEKAA